MKPGTITRVLISMTAIQRRRPQDPVQLQRHMNHQKPTARAQRLSHPHHGPTRHTSVPRTAQNSRPARKFSSNAWRLWRIAVRSLMLTATGKPASGLPSQARCCASVPVDLACFITRPSIAGHFCRPTIWTAPPWWSNQQHPRHAKLPRLPCHPAVPTSRMPWH